jgi:predicted aspartyl protease
MAEHRAQYLKDTPPTRVICTALLLAMTSCITPKPLVITARPVVEASQPHPGDAPHAAIRWYNTFWKALADMNVQAAWIVADGSEQRKLADAIEDFLAGNNAAADSTVVPLLSARDSVVRNAARITYGAILTAEGNWTRLAVYADSARTASRDAAGVETWASAFKGVSTSISFGDSVSVVPLGRSRSGVPIVPVIVNGVKRYFWLDTGSSITILTSDVANASHITGISGDTLELVTSVGRLPTQAAVIASLKVGRVTVTNARAMIVSSGALQMREVASDLMPQTIDGVIGFDVIRSLDLTIDDVNGRVVIRKPALRAHGKGEDEGRNLSWYGVPIVTLISETGAAVHLVLDTGAEETFGTPGMATKTHARWRPAERRTVLGFGGSKSESGIAIPSVRLYLGDVPLTFKRIFLYEAQYPTIFTLDGTLGADAGRGGMVRIDMTNGRLDIKSK